MQTQKCPTENRWDSETITATVTKLQQCYRARSPVAYFRKRVLRTQLTNPTEDPKVDEFFEKKTQLPTRKQQVPASDTNVKSGIKVPCVE